MYNVSMRFEVPQFIEVESKIFGPLTWKQFLYVAGGFGFAGVLFLTTPLLVFGLLGLPIAILSAALAFYPVNNRPFIDFLESFFTYFTTNKVYLWKQTNQVVYDNKPASGEAGAGAVSSFAPPTKNAGVASLARRLELEAIQKQDS